MGYSIFNALGNIVNKTYDATIGRVVSGVKSVAGNAGSLVGNILTAGTGYNPNVTPKVAMPPSVGTGAVVPTRPVPSGPYQNFTPTPPNTSTPGGTVYTPQPQPLNYTPAPSQPQTSTPIPKATIQQPTNSGTVFNVNPDTTSMFGGVPTTGWGGWGGASSGQFGGGTGISGISGGASLLPGSLGGTMRSIGSWLLPSTEEEKKKKNQLISQAENQPFVGPFDRVLNPMQSSGGMVDATGQPLTSTQGTAFSKSNVDLSNIPQGGYAGGSTNMNINGFTNPLVYKNGMLGTQQTFPSALSGESATTKFNPFQGGALSPAEQNMVDQMGSTSGLAPKVSVTEIPTTKDLVNRATSSVPSGTIIKLGTASDMSKFVSDSTRQVLEAKNQLNTQHANGTVNDATINLLSQNSQQLFGRQMAPDEVAKYAQTEGGKTMYDLTFQNIRDNFVDPTTGAIYKKEDFDPSTYKNLFTEGDARQAEIDRLKKDQEELNKQNPYLGETKQVFDENVYRAEGVLSTQALIQQKQDNLNAALGVFENIAAEVKNDPDFSKKLKATRLSFIDDKKIAQVNVLQRELDSLREDLKTKVETANRRINSAMDQYNIYVKERSFTAGQIDTLNAQIEKASDNARAAFNSIASNPDFIKGATQEELNREYASIQKNGYIPITMLERLGKNTGKDIKGALSYQTSATTKTTYFYDDKGQIVSQFTGSDVSQSAGSKPTINGQQYDSYKDVPQSNGDIVRNYLKNGVIIAATTIPGGGKNLTPAQTATTFKAWLGSNGVKGTMDKKTIQDLGTKYGVVIDDKTADLYDKAHIWSSTSTPTQTFDQYKESIYGPGSANTSMGNTSNAGGTSVTNPQTGESYPIGNFTPAELDEAKTLGWVIQ